MDLLPSVHTEFQSQAYWDRFFQSRQGDAFEWYLDVGDLVPYLATLPHQKTLHVGTGNSDLPLRLREKHGFNESIGVDFSSESILEMKEKVKGCDGIEFLQMDVLEMMFPAEHFDLVIDKGLFDAMMPVDTKENRDRAARYASETDHVLKKGGTFVLVSLLEDHVVSLLFNSVFLHTFNVDIHPIMPREGVSPLCPFMLICRKNGSVGINIHDLDQKVVCSIQEPASYQQVIYGSISEIQKTYSEHCAAIVNQHQSLAKNGLYLKLSLQPVDTSVSVDDVLTSLLKTPFKGVHWIHDDASIVPLAFGIRTIQIGLIIDESILDPDAIMELLQRQHSDSIASVDKMEQRHVRQR